MDPNFLRDIHRYWFGELKSPDDLPRDKLQLWFQKSDDTDRHIHETFGRFIPEAAKASWDLALLSREETVALVVLFDQFPRNLFRESGEAFAYDAKALAIAKALIAGGLDRFFRAERTAIALPLEHSEDIADQDYCVMLFAEAAVHGPADWLAFNRSQLDYGAKHRDLIRKFGRFPHRNTALGRESTPEELAFLAEKGRGF